MKKKKFTSKIAGKLVTLSLCAMLIACYSVPVFATGEEVAPAPQTGDNNQVIVDDTYQYTNTDYYKISKNNALGISGGFHMVAFGEITTGAHTNGNILANSLNYRSNFGTKGLGELSYIQNLSNASNINCANGKNLNTLLAVGNSIDVGKMDNGNAWALDDEKVENPTPKELYNDSTLGEVSNLWQDATDKAFIDFVAVKSDMVELNKELSEEANSEDVAADFSDQNNQKITINSTESGYYAYNLELDKYLQDRRLKVVANIDGLADRGAAEVSSDEIEYSTLMINADLSGRDTFNIHGLELQYSNDVMASNGEVNVWENGNVLLNVYDSSEEDGQYHGDISISEKFAGHIVAPNANVTIKSNLNGTVIAEDIDIEAETHRSDFTGPLLKKAGARYVDPKAVDIAAEEPSIGEEDPSVGEEDPAIGDEEPSVGEDDPSIGEEDPATEDPADEPSIQSDDFGVDDPTVEDPTEDDPVAGEEDLADDPSEEGGEPSVQDDEVDVEDSAVDPEDGEGNDPAEDPDNNEEVNPDEGGSETIDSNEEEPIDKKTGKDGTKVTDPNQPKTSDNSNILIPLIMMQISALVAAVAVIRKKLWGNR